MCSSRCKEKQILHRFGRGGVGVRSIQRLSRGKKYNFVARDHFLSEEYGWQIGGKSSTSVNSIPWNSCKVTTQSDAIWRGGRTWPYIWSDDKMNSQRWISRSLQVDRAIGQIYLFDGVEFNLFIYRQHRRYVILAPQSGPKLP